MCTVCMKGPRGRDALIVKNVIDETRSEKENGIRVEGNCLEWCMCKHGGLMGLL